MNSTPAKQYRPYTWAERTELIGKMIQPKREAWEMENDFDDFNKNMRTPHRMSAICYTLLITGVVILPEKYAISNAQRDDMITYAAMDPERCYIIVTGPVSSFFGAEINHYNKAAYISFRKLFDNFEFVGLDQTVIGAQV